LDDEMISALSGAKWLCEKSGWRLSNLQLQKLLYIAHMLHLGNNNGEPLIDGRFEAWNYGPVEKSVYHRAKVFGADPVGNIFYDVPDIKNAPTAFAALEETYEALKSASPAKLVAVTHWEKGAWAKHYIPGARGIVIPNSDIAREYHDRIKSQPTK
jgi:uncharacterized phage-associated protein